MPTSIKTIKGHHYLYYTFYDDGKKKDVYCGLASKPESKRKSLELELKYLKNQSRNYIDRAKQIEKKLSSPKHS